MVGHHNMAKPAKFYVRVGTAGITSTALVEKGRNNVTMMTGNLAFATPEPALATVTTACNTLDAATQAYNFNRGKVEKDARDMAYDALYALLGELGSYVQTASNGAKDVILSAGFDVRRTPEPLGQLQAPPNMRATVAPYPGTLLVRWGGVRGRQNYRLEVAIGSPTAEWTVLTVTSKPRFVVEGLQSNEVYYFRVAAIGAAGISPVSDITSAKAA
jgi:hypothetical protein